jgi:hypothetical protein
MAGWLTAAMPPMCWTARFRRCAISPVLAADPVNPPLAAGEIVSTGTLTKAMPVFPGETWTAAPKGIALDAIRLGFT